MHPQIYITLQEGGEWIEVSSDDVHKYNWAAMKMEDWIYDRVLTLCGENPWRQVGNMRPSLNKPPHFVVDLFSKFLP